MLKQSLKDSWFFFKNHAIAISIIVLPIVVPIEIISALYQNVVASDSALSKELIPVFIGLLVNPVYSVAIIFYMVSAISSEKVDTKTLWKMGVKFWLPFLFLSVIMGTAILFGLVLLLVPGILLAVRYSFADFDLLLNKNTPLDAMKNSWNLSREYMWVILGGLTIISIALYVPHYLVSSLFEDSSMASKIFTSATNIIYAVLNVIYTIFTFRIYELAKVKHNETSNHSFE